MFYSPFILISQIAISSFTQSRMRSQFATASLAQLEVPIWNFKFAAYSLLLPMHLRRDFEAQAVQPDETRGVVLVVGFGRVGFHRGDVRVVEAHRGFAAGDHDVALVKFTRTVPVTFFCDS